VKKITIILITLACAVAMVTAAFAAEVTLWTCVPGEAGTQTVTMRSLYCTNYMGFLRFYSRASELTITFDLPKGDFEGYTLRVTDAGTLTLMDVAVSGGQHGVWSPMTLRVNNQTVAENIDINTTEEQTRTFAIGKYLKDGSNSITFTLGPSARTRYDLKSVSLIKS
jgi:hypothetical protein